MSLVKILSLLLVAGLYRIECKPRASLVSYTRALRSPTEAVPVTYQQPSPLVPEAYGYSALPTAPLGATSPYQALNYAASPYYAASLPGSSPLPYSLQPSAYTRAVAQQFVPAAAPVGSPIASPGVAAYSYPVQYINPYAAASGAGRSVHALTQAVLPSGQFIG